MLTCPLAKLHMVFCFCHLEYLRKQGRGELRGRGGVRWVRRGRGQSLHLEVFFEDLDKSALRERQKKGPSPV